MSTKLKYMPVLRGRQQEFIVLKSFDFQDRIFPCMEIIKELDRLPQKPKPNAKKPQKIKKEKKFEDVYLPLIVSIKAEKVFIDLPVHLRPTRNMKPVTRNFLQTVVVNRKARTEYMKKLISLSGKVIPVISSYHNITGERNSIVLQEKDLRPDFKILAFRTFPEDFTRDIPQIETILTKNDYIIVDWGDSALNKDDSEQKEIIEKLESLNCYVIIHRNAISKDLTNVDLPHDKQIQTVDNSLLEKFKDFSGLCFSDYSGIKKDLILDGGAISPGFPYYDAAENKFYGYKGVYKKPATFETIIIPDVIKSKPTQRMRTHTLDYLGK